MHGCCIKDSARLRRKIDKFHYLAVIFLVLMKLCFILIIYAIALPVILQQNHSENSFGQGIRNGCFYKTLRAERAAKSSIFTV